MSTDGTQSLTLSVVMPALNEEGNIEGAIDDALAALDEFHIAGEIMVVNDGSSDRTASLVRGRMQRDARVKMIEHPSPQGFGASFWDGVAHTDGVAVIMLPGDNEVDPWEALRYFAFLKHVDIVIPFVFNKHVRGPFRVFLSFLYRQIVNATFRTNFNYTNGTILYRRFILNQFTPNSKGFFFQTEILIKAVKSGYLFAEVPYRLHLRKGGKSKAVSFPSFLNVVKGYFQLIRDVYFRRKGGDSRSRLHADSVSSQRRFSEEGHAWRKKPAQGPEAPASAGKSPT